MHVNEICIGTVQCETELKAAIIPITVCILQVMMLFNCCGTNCISIECVDYPKQYVVLSNTHGETTSH